MKHVKVLIVSIAFLIGVLLFAPQVLAVNSYTSGDSVVLTKDRVISGDYFASGNTVILDGTVDGDAYVAGGNVVVNGVVNGDVLAVGGNISVTGKVNGNLRTAGGQIVISGDVSKNVTAAGGSISIQNPARIAGSLVTAGGNLSLLTPIDKGLTFAGGQVTIDNRIGGDAFGGVGQLTLSPQASVGGNLTYWSGGKGNIASGAVVAGQTVFHKTDWNTQTQKKQPAYPVAGIFTGLGIAWTLLGMLSSFLLGLLLLSFVPVYMQQVVTTFRTRPWESLGIGVLAVILSPLIFLVLLVTIIGVPFGFIFGLAFLMVLLLNEVFISYALGKIILPQRRVLALLLGVVIYGVVSIIPLIGWIWDLVALFMGMGMFILVEKQLYNTLREKKVV